MKLSLKKLVLMAIAAHLFSTQAQAATSFTVKNIQYYGLHRISVSTVSNYLPIHIGQTLTPERSVEVIKSLYKTGFFQAVELERNGDTLMVRVVERGTIGNVNVQGNHEFSSDILRHILKQLGVVKGQVFQQSALERFKAQLKQEYNNRGKYNAQIITRVIPLTQNRVGISITISEGRVARIKKINFIGNRHISTSELLSQMELKEAGFLSYFTKRDQYNRDLLDLSLQAIKNYYLDRGYLKFNILSSQVLLAPDKKSVYVNVRLDEGPVYTYSGFKIVGNLPIDKTFLHKQIAIKSGDTFSRQQVTAAIHLIGEALGNVGYGFPAINAEPTFDEASKQVYITFVVQPGRRVYVRHINFQGNTKTADYALRAAIKQVEGGVISLQDIKESERQLKILGYLKNINFKTVPVADTNNQVDLVFNVEEAPSAEASLSVGYGTNGPELNAGFNQRNFMGTGKTVGLDFNTSYWGKNYGINYYDPFYTSTGVGRGFDIFYQTVDPRRLDISSYTSDKYGFAINYNITVGDNSSAQLGYGYDRLKITSIGSKPATQIEDFINRNGRTFGQVKFNAGWHYNTYDQQPFPTRGVNQQINLMLALPVLGGDLKYYKSSYQSRAYFPIGDSGFLFTVLTNAAYGNTFNRHGLPFFENYFAGGIAQPGQVRGFDNYSLGPKDSNGHNLGGNLLVGGSVGLVLPAPLSRDGFRTTAFVDMGNVYGKHVPKKQQGTRAGPLRYSLGVALDWRSPFGPLSFSLAKPLNKQRGDDLALFQFTIMSGF